MTDLQKLMKRANKLSEQNLAGYQKEIIRQYKTALTNIKTELALFYEKNYTTLQLETLMTKVENILKNAGTKGLTTTKKGVKEAVTFNYNVVQTNLQKTIRLEATTVINENMVNSLVVNNKIAGVSWQSKGISNINDATLKIRNDIAQGIINGKNYGDVAKKITENTNIAASDALRIVKTEVHRASNEAQILSMNDSKTAAEELGYTPVKIWNSSGGSFTRGHNEMNGVSIPVDEDFILPSGVTAEAPGLSGDPSEDINCNCYLTFDIVELKNV